MVDLLIYCRGLQAVGSMNVKMFPGFQSRGLLITTGLKPRAYQNVSGDTN